jgi:VIT1/CCC1 family predicted Fe2+/Mn2+ transporter
MNSQINNKSDSNNALDPLDRFSEVVFGLIMAVSITGTISVATAGEQDIRQLLFAAFGCNIAWGFVDAVMYVISNLATRGRVVSIERAIAAAKTAEDGQRIVAQSLPNGVADALPAAVLDGIRAAIVQRAQTLPRVRVTRDDMLGALRVFFLVVTSTLPVALPFVLFTNVITALRISNGVALALLFLCGAGLGHHAGFGGWRSGFTMLAIGAVLVMVTIAFGG